VLSIIILIQSFNNKHTINVSVYIGFDVYVQFQRKGREECEWVLCNLGKIMSKCFLLIYIYIYIYIYMSIFVN